MNTFSDFFLIYIFVILVSAATLPVKIWVVLFVQSWKRFKSWYIYYLVTLSCLNKYKLIELLLSTRSCLKGQSVRSPVSSDFIACNNLKVFWQAWFRGVTSTSKLFDNASENQNTKSDEWFQKIPRASVIYVIWDCFYTQTNPHILNDKNRSLVSAFWNKQCCSAFSDMPLLWLKALDAHTGVFN